jgi:hypothetical protein
MRRISIALWLATLVAIGLLLREGGGRAQPPARVGLPGALAPIDASAYPTLQAAIDAVPPGGGVVRFPAGSFEITQPLVIKTEDVMLEGAGAATLISNKNQEGQPAIVIRPNVPASDSRTRLWRVTLKNFRVVGNPKSGHGIEARGVNEIHLDGVTASYHGGDGIRLDNCYEDPRVVQCLITYNKQVGLNLIACHDIVVSTNQFEENNDALHCTDGFNLCMTGNCLDDHLRHGVVIENTYGSVVSGNMIEECQGTGIILDRDCYGITLSANVIAHEFAGGIELRDAHGCAVTGNSFPIVLKNALMIGPESGRITVSGNTFSDTYIGGGKTKRQLKDQPASGITLNGASDINISGNTFSGLTTKALAVEGECRRVLFSGNLLLGVESEHAKLLDSQAANNLISAAP